MFVDDEDCETYLSMLQAFTTAADVTVHGFALMKTHDHILATPHDASALPTAMRRLGVSYVRYFNRKHDRIGTLFNERYRGLVVTDDTYWLMCLRYIDQNPVRAGIASQCEDYRWSSYRIHAGLEKSDWIAPHPVFEALGKELPHRYAVYQALCATALTQTELIAQRRGTDPGRSQVRPGSVPNDTSSDLVSGGSGIDLAAS
jgi:putative transposase